MKIKYKSIGYSGIAKRGRAGQKIQYIVLHTMDGKTDANGDLYNWFSSGRAGGSAHFGIGFNGTITNYVNVNDTAIANGSTLKKFPHANERSISIEFADNGNPNDSKRTDALYKSGGELIAYLIDRFNLGSKAEFNKNIFLHKQLYSKKTCPGRLDYERLIRIANVKLKEMVKKAVAQKPSANSPKTNETPITADTTQTLPIINPTMSESEIIREKTLGDALKDAMAYGGGSGAIAVAITILFSQPLGLDSDLKISAAQFLIAVFMNNALVIAKRLADKFNL